MRNRVKIILVDDHDIVMDGIESILHEAEHLQVVGKASSAHYAEKLISFHLPDLVLTDISMGEVSGLTLTKNIISSYPSIKVMVLTMHENTQHINAMLEAGAVGYLLKTVKQDELLAAINIVLSGKQYIQQSVAGSYARMINAQKDAESRSPLSKREIGIIRMIAQGLTTVQISNELYISERTVETHRKNILRKTGTKGVVGLLNYARDNGIL